MAMIRRGDADRVTRDALVLDLGDLARRGESILQQAKQRAQAIEDEARRERERIIAGAKELGLSQGVEEGRRQGIEKGRAEGRSAALAEAKAAVDALVKSWSDALERFAGERERMLAEARNDVLRLAVLIAERVTKRAVEVSEESVSASQAEALLSLVSRPTRARLAVHPADAAAVGELMPEFKSRFANIRHVEIESDPSLGRGSCVLRTDGGARFDASIDTQIRRIAEAMLPGASAVRRGTDASEVGGESGEVGGAPGRGGDGSEKA